MLKSGCYILWKTVSTHLGWFLLWGFCLLPIFESSSWHLNLNPTNQFAQITVRWIPWTNYNHFLSPSTIFDPLYFFHLFLIVVNCSTDPICQRGSLYLTKQFLAGLMKSQVLRTVAILLRYNLWENAFWRVAH